MKETCGYLKTSLTSSVHQDPDVFLSGFFSVTMSGVALNCFQARGAEADHQAGRAGPCQLEAGAVPRRHLAGLLLLRVEGGQVHGEGEPSVFLLEKSSSGYNSEASHLEPYNLKMERIKAK